MNLQLISWNINGLSVTNQTKINGIQSIIKLNPDLILFQEVKNNYNSFKSKLGSILTPSHDLSVFCNTGYSGVATISKNNLGCHECHITAEVDHDYDYYNQCRILVSYFSDPKVAIFNVYMPNAGSGLIRLDFKSQWMTSFNTILKSVAKSGYKIIVMGDMNVIPGPEDIRYYDRNHNISPGVTDSEASAYHSILYNLNLVDVAVKLDKRNNYTFFGRFPKIYKPNTGWRLDHVWISKDIKIKDYKVLLDVDGSDHYPIYVELSI